MPIKNFYYSFPTIYYFGNNAIDNLRKHITNDYKKLLVVTGASSARKLGILEQIENICSANNVKYVEYTNCPANPSFEIVDEISKILIEQDIDLIVAIGGGSVIDASKAAIFKLKENKEIHLGTVLTMPASGSESNRSFVIYDPVTNNKLAKADNYIIPKFAICDPSYLNSLTQNQISCCLSDIMSHLFEQFFCLENWSFIDDLILAAMKTVIRIKKRIDLNLCDIEAKQELMLISSFALSYLLSCGRTLDWVAHSIEHAISGRYKTKHGEGISIIMPKWIRYCSNNEYYAYRLKKMAEEFNLDNTNNSVENAILFIELFYENLSLPRFISNLVKKPNLQELSKIITQEKNIGRVNSIDSKECIEFLQILWKGNE